MKKEKKKKGKRREKPEIIAQMKGLNSLLFIFWCKLSTYFDNSRGREENWKGGIPEKEEGGEDTEGKRVEI